MEMLPKADIYIYMITVARPKNSRLLAPKILERFLRVLLNAVLNAFSDSKIDSFFILC